MLSIGLVVTGTIVGSVTLNPIVMGTISGCGVLIQGYVLKSGLSKKVEHCKFAYTNYHKIMVQLKSYLRGMPYDETIFLSDAKVIEDIVIDMCPPINAQQMSLYFGYEQTSPDVVVLKDGKVNKPIDMGKFKITQSSAPTNNGDLANKEYVDKETGLATTSAILAASAGTDAAIAKGVITTTTDISKNITYGTSKGNINMNGNKISGLPTPTNGGDAVSKTYVDGISPTLSGTATGNIDMSNYVITHPTAPSIGNHLVNKTYVDSKEITSNPRIWSFYLSGSSNFPQGINDDWPHLPIVYSPNSNSYVRISNLGLAYATSNSSTNVTIEVNICCKTIINNVHKEEYKLVHTKNCRTGRFTLPDGETSRVFCYDINQDYKFSDITSNWKNVKGFTAYLTVSSGASFNLRAVLSVCTVEK